ncbi:Serine/threonine-protein kinase/endoribonuclease IRE1 [Gossypium arboreum]|uniref:non-specific serine/threonine protein kinase n=1 Tax=Gossypium arboreum TaxID=29729 RepID=A0A0B0NHB4_GOSAR|nr:serine/threonine-protein kinase/endoribonuclease IRE1a-like [Gossypium arboreum]KHG10461.1 Serine/threonine-protein kinase/endoribonuclease IRE1 [Gossypium arboreum]
MRLLFFCFLILLSSAFSTPIAIHVPDAQSTGILRAGGRSLLSLSEQETELAARTDGTIVLRTINSKRVIWSFASGSPIYSSYQAPPTLDNGNEAASRPITAFFIDCGDDWELYAHATHSNKMKLPVTVEEFVKHMPHVSEEGAITVGSKRTTVYVVDAMTGKLLHVYRSPDSPSALEPDKEGTPLSDNGNGNKELLNSAASSIAQRRFHITRTDYTLQSFHPNSDKVSWSLMVSEIGAALLCQDVKFTVNSSYEFPEIGNDFVLPFPCQSKGIVIREHNTTEYTSTSHHDDPMLPLSSSNAPTSLAKPDSTSDDRHNRKMLLVAAPESKLQLPHKVDRLLNLSQDNENETSVPQPPLENSDSRMFGVHDLRTPHADGHGKAIFSKYPVVFSFIFFIILVGFVINHVLLAKRLSALKDQPVANINIGSSNRKKSRRSGKINGSIEKKDQHTSSGSEDEFSPVGADNEKLLDLNKLVGSFDGRRIGKLIVLSKEIAKGSNGTIILEGFYEGRAVAVKRLVQAHHDVAFKEIQNLIVSDQHPNIVRWYGVEYDQDFVYLALERCTCSLDDLIQIYSDTPGNSVLSKDPATRAMVEHKIHLDLVKGAMQDLNLWKANGHPSQLFLKLMRDMVSGLAHLHDLGIIHRDIKPQNVLIIKEKTVCAKLSDMGISKRLLEDRSSLGHHATGCGSSGWQAPEQLLLGRQTRAVDLFSLGCVLFFCITRGKHPFGNHLERDINVVNNRVNLFLVEHIPEAVDLISCLLNPEPELRPSALEVLRHPLFWSCEMKLSFLQETSDRVELEDRKVDSDILKALESVAPMALGGKWNEKMEHAFIANIGYYRRYKFDSVRDLLRVMRNKSHHYRELPIEIQELVGSVPEGFYGYFASRFPRLFIEVYKVVSSRCREEECFQKYF